MSKKEAKTHQSDIFEEILKWIFTVIGVFLLLRLLILIITVAVKAIGAVADGSAVDTVLSALSSVSPLAVATQIIIITIVVTLYFIDNKKRGPAVRHKDKNQK